MRGIRVAIDIGTTAITTVVAQRERRDGKLRIIGVGRTPVLGMRRGAIIDSDEVVKSLRKSLGEASRQAAIRIRSAVLGIGGSHISSFPIRGVVAVSRADGEVTEEDVRRVLGAAEGLIPKNPNREVLHIIPRYFRVDGQEPVLDPHGLVGMKLEVDAIVVDGAKTALQNLVKCCEAVGLDIEDWAVGVLAAAGAVMTKSQKELGVMLLDLGGGTTDFVIFEEGRLMELGAIPLGGHHITSDIAIGFRTNVAVAETVKQRLARVIPRNMAKTETIRLAEFGSNDEASFTERELVEIVEARLADIFELAAKALKRVGRAGLLPGGILLIGGGAQIPGIRDLAKRELGLPVEAVPAIALEEIEGEIDLSLITAVGLLLWSSIGHSPYSGYGGELLAWSGLGRRLKSFFRSFLP